MMRSAPGRLWPSLLLLSACLLPTLAHAAEPTAGIMGSNLWETFQRGGICMYPILGCSIVALALLLELLIRTRTSVILPPASVAALAGADAQDQVPALIKAQPQRALHRVLAAGDRWRRGDNTQKQAAIEEVIDGLLWELKRTARPLGLMANISTLLGLLGTVQGIIVCFEAIAHNKTAMGDPTAMATGIAQALLATFFGLAVAIPVLVAYHWIVGRIEAQMRQCEMVAKHTYILPPK